MIYRKLLKKSVELMDDIIVTDVRMGLGYTAVENSAGGLGLAYTFRDRLPSTCSIFRDAGNLIGKKLRETAELFLDNNLLDSSVGLASINSVTSVSGSEILSGDVLEALEIEKNEAALMIGHFAPVEKQLRSITSNLFVHDDKFDSDNESTDLFVHHAKDSRVVLITSTTLINKTLDDIITKTPNARMRVLLGPSTPMFPGIFMGEGIALLSGMLFKDRKMVKEIVSQGGGTMHFKNYSQKVNLVVKSAEEAVLKK
jgi:uncharacterized protein